jgi:fumarate hydratase, class II
MRPPRLPGEKIHCQSSTECLCNVVNEEYRVESDSMGEMRVPVSALYGAQTARAAENFPISSLRFSRSFLRALALLKKHAAATNASLGLLPAELASAISAAAQEVAQGEWDDHFVVDVFQTGSGTSTNMNANEVIANRAGELLGGSRGGKQVHPNDHVNRGQSSNDVIPSALHIATLSSLEEQLLPSLELLRSELARKTGEFHDILKIGRTHYQDATPVRLGQEFGGYASQVSHGIDRIRAVMPHLAELPLGGTAVGTGINTHRDFARLTIERIAKETGLPLCEAPDHFEAQGARDAAVEASGALKTVAASLLKIANDIRFLASGPRLGIGEIQLPATQPGSSIMPAKVNPVMCEMLIQICVQVIGNDTTITVSGALGHLELNTMIPVIAHNLLQSIELLAAGSRVFAIRCVAGIEADRQKCEEAIERSLALATALVPVLGYDRAASIAKNAFQTGRTIRAVALEMTGLGPARVDELLDPASQTRSSDG